MLDENMDYVCEYWTKKKNGMKLSLLPDCIISLLIWI